MEFLTPKGISISALPRLKEDHRRGIRTRVAAKERESTVKCCSGYDMNQLWVPMHNLLRIQPVDIPLWILDDFFFIFPFC